MVNPEITFFIRRSTTSRHRELMGSCGTQTANFIFSPEIYKNDEEMDAAINKMQEIMAEFFLGEQKSIGVSDPFAWHLRRKLKEDSRIIQ